MTQLSNSQAGLFQSEATTHGIRVRVESQFDSTRSRPFENQWFFLYTVSISNQGTEAAQLVSRHWVITDGEGRVEEVQGPGVVGEQPVLEPGQEFRYTSGCPLPTSIGSMQGTYRMVTVDGQSFDAEIAPFLLGQPQMVN